jgi:hypothetical protein
LTASEESEEERLVLGIKLAALEEEVERVRGKLRGAVGREIMESAVRRV